jgi:hypothetical protein
MDRLLKVMLLGIAVILSVPQARAQANPDADSGAKTAADTSDLERLPPAPKGKSTIIGGEIRNVDPVLDQFMLKAYGEKPIKVFFDARTEVYRDGNRIPLSELGPELHASVQTVLDGSNVFAISIHMLSQAPQGDVQGNVEEYDPSTGMLTVRTAMSRVPIRVQVKPDTQIVREGQSAFTAEPSGPSDLMNGAMVSVKFQSNRQGRGVATRIEVLATPGASFIFSGNLTALDVHAGRLVLVDPRDDKSYQISFDAANMPSVQKLHTGDKVRVSANFNGFHYEATEITAQ